MDKYIILLSIVHLVFGWKLYWSKKYWKFWSYIYDANKVTSI